MPSSGAAEAPEGAAAGAAGCAAEGASAAGDEEGAAASRIPTLSPRVTNPPNIPPRLARELNRLKDTNKSGLRQAPVELLPEKRRSNLRK